MVDSRVCSCGAPFTPAIIVTQVGFRWLIRDETILSDREPTASVRTPENMTDPCRRRDFIRVERFARLGRIIKLIERIELPIGLCDAKETRGAAKH